MANLTPIFSLCSSLFQRGFHTVFFFTCSGLYLGPAAWEKSKGVADGRGVAGPPHLSSLPHPPLTAGKQGFLPRQHLLSKYPGVFSSPG